MNIIKRKYDGNRSAGGFWWKKFFYKIGEEKLFYVLL